VTQLTQLISGAIETHPTIRGPRLAELDLLANAVRRNWHKYPRVNALNLLETYVKNFASKPICALDLAYIIPVLLPSVHTQKQVRPSEPSLDVGILRFLEDIIRHSEDEITIPGNVQQIFRRLCAYQIARANRHPIPTQQLICAYFTHVPERLTPPNINLTNTEVPDRTSSLDLCPADGFLLLATSSLADSTNRLTHNTCTVGNFSQALLIAHWIDQLGLAHARSNHHFRLRLCSLLSLYGLACPELSIPQAEGLEMKQLLFVSLGHMIVSPGPLLTLWANPSTANAQQGASGVTLLTFFQRLHALSGTSVSEAEECLVAAYRRRVYTKIGEFTKFAETLKYADVFLLVRMELVYWQIAVVPDDFDILLENLGGASKELELVASRIDKIVDCRDFSVSQNFDPPLENHVTQENSFAHTVRWIRLRMITVRAICQCTQLLMSSVKLSEHLLNSNDQQASVKRESDSRAVEAMKQLQIDDELLTDLIQQTDDSTLSAPKDVHSFLSDLVLPSQLLLTAPTQLPRIQLSSLYLRGPYKIVLESGVRLLVGIHQLLVGGHESFSEVQQTTALQGLENPFRAIPQLVKESDRPDWTALPRPKSGADKSYLLATDDAHSPTSVLLLLGMLYETFTLDCLLVSMARSVLRPRSHYLQQMSKRQRRKAAKIRKSKGMSETNPGIEVTDENDDSYRRADTTVFRRLDQIGSSLISVVSSLTQTASSLTDLVDAWLHWSRKCAAQELLEISASLCMKMFPDDLMTQFPVIKPNHVTTLFTQIASSYEHGFAHLSSGLHQKSANLGRILNELQVYECTDKLAACHL
ncbi:hypothetical protein D915_007814, partial [Fasciola hepatica]